MLATDYDDRPQSGAAKGRDRLSHHSSQIEKIVEYRFLAELHAEAFRRDVDLSVMRDDVDKDGRDLTLEGNRTSRPIQLKATVEEGARRSITVNTGLSSRRSACVIWLTYEPGTFALRSIAWFGGMPGELLPPIGTTIARHTRRDSGGMRRERPNHRVLPRNRFETLSGIGELVDRLFGTSDASERAVLRKHITRPPDQRPGRWLRDVATGQFDAIPTDINFTASDELAHLIDGYALADELNLGCPDGFLQRQIDTAHEMGRWPGTGAELWITLFLQHRRYRFANGQTPEPVTAFLNDLLCRQLRQSLVELAPSFLTGIR